MDKNDLDENISENEEIPENLPSLGQNEVDLDIEPPESGNFMGVASKKLINLLLKRKIIFIGIVGVSILLFTAIFFGANVSSDTFNYKYMESVDNKCEVVTVSYNPYGVTTNEVSQMSLEDYVSSATYTYTANLKNTDEGTYHLYKALAIALRNEIISNNCSITYKDKSLSKNPGNNETLNSALQSAKGIVISKAGKKKLMNVSVSDFCYSTNDGNNYTIFQVPNFYIPTDWVNQNVPSKYKDCPCNQPDENLYFCYTDGDIKEWVHQDDTSGFNVYAAYYLSDEYKLSWSDILKYFVGDHNYWTIEKQAKDEQEEENKLKENCGSIDLHKTSLTKTEFVNGIKSFNYNGESPSGWNKFVSNAEMIYEVSLENDINPEFVIIRAILEGFSPGEWKNNYWGWKCYNTDTSQCEDFGPDFKTAIAKYCQAVHNQYTDYNDLLKTYAYLGDYWYTLDTPDPTSDGGCYYAPYVFPDGIPSRVQNACNGPSCIINADPTNCTKTTEEDQILYGKFQDRNTQKYRESIWNLTETDCKMTANGAGCMWWPIGSRNTTIKDGVTYADGEPETTTITSGFGQRDAPIQGASTNHNAIDIGGGREGQTNIIASADGTVTDTNTGCVSGNHSCGGQLGNYVIITHNDGSITRYGHLYSLSVNKGDTVKQGQVIGKMGNTGNSTGPHLDFQVQVNGEIVDPTNLVSASDTRKICSGDGTVLNGIDNKQTICLTLKNSGYSNYAIAGIMGNLKSESEFDPNAINNYGYAGIAQWGGDRLNNLKSTYGNNWNVLDNQLKFLVMELNNSYTSVENYLRGDYDEVQMAQYFCENYEKANSCGTDRTNNAQELFNYIQNDCE